jgi:hypothetical protein
MDNFFIVRTKQVLMSSIEVQPSGFAIFCSTVSSGSDYA